MRIGNEKSASRKCGSIERRSPFDLLEPRSRVIERTKKERRTSLGLEGKESSPISAMDYSYVETSRATSIGHGRDVQRQLCGSNSIAPFLLSAIQGNIGCFQQVLDTLSVVGKHRDADGERYRSK
jgi:hypothetical protein